jgi:hypothetical protein
VSTVDVLRTPHRQVVLLPLQFIAQDVLVSNPTAMMSDFSFLLFLFGA